MNRRKFLSQSMKGIGLGVLSASPLAYFLSHVMNGYRYRAFAQSVSPSGYDTSKSFVNICMNGGPPAWFWQSPCRPNGASDPFQYNPENNPKNAMLINRLIPVSNPNDGVLGYCGEYATHEVNGVHLPYLWKSKIATPGGGFTQMDLLAKNMLMMRGLSTIDGHVNAGLPVNPPGGSSLGGLLAEKSQRIFPAIGYRTDKRFYQSLKGIPIAPLDIGSPILNLFYPFNIENTVLDSNSNDIGEAMNQVLDAMKAQAGEHHRLFPDSYRERLNARNLMKRNYSQLTSAYTTIRDKYANLISRSFGDASLRLAGVDDLQIQGARDIKQLRTEITGSFDYYIGNDLSTMIDQSTYIRYFAEGFAVTEFMLTGGSLFDQSFCSYSNIVLGSSMYNCNDVDGTTATTLLAIDSHASGAFVQLIQFARYYRALSSCLYELVQKLKSKTTSDGKTLFDHTVIALTSEFSRDAADEKNTADHGWRGSNYTLVSGMVPNTMVVGNILKSTGILDKNNTWGQAAPLEALGNQKANYGNAISTVANFLGIESPSSNNAALITRNPSTGELTSIIGPAKNMENENG